MCVYPYMSLVDTYIFAHYIHIEYIGISYGRTNVLCLEENVDLEIWTRLEREMRWTLE